MVRFLVFRLGELSYALELSQVQEVLETADFHYIPRAPSVYGGALNVHGSIVPTLDLAVLLGIAAAAPGPRVIVLAPEVERLALAVSVVVGILGFAADDPPPLAPPEAGAPCARARFTDDAGTTIHLLDPAQLRSRLEQL